MKDRSNEKKGGGWGKRDEDVMVQGTDEPQNAVILRDLGECKE